jgi:hypothetical protein
MGRNILQEGEVRRLVIAFPDREGGAVEESANSETQPQKQQQLANMAIPSRAVEVLFVHSAKR